VNHGSNERKTRYGYQSFVLTFQASGEPAGVVPAIAVSAIFHDKLQISCLRDINLDRKLLELGNSVGAIQFLSVSAHNEDNGSIRWLDEPRGCLNSLLLPRPRSGIPETGRRSNPALASSSVNQATSSQITT